MAPGPHVMIGRLVTRTNTGHMFSEAILTSLFILVSKLTGARGDDPKPSVVLRGAGASFPKEVYSEWLPTYMSSRRRWVNIEMGYQPIGSSRGKQAVMGQGGLEVEYAGSDEDMTAQEREDYPDLMLFPTMAGAVVIGYNLDLGLNQTLTLTLEQVVGIYNGTYRSWSDPAFLSLNPNATLPDENIVVVAREDGSGTTYSVTSAFCSVPTWNATYGRFSDSSRWNSSVITYYAQKTRGMSGVILSFRNSIGYLVVSDAIASEVSQARLVNSFGVIASPTSDSVQLAMDGAARMMRTRLVVPLSEHQGPDTYPIASFTYLIVKMRTMENCHAAVELLRYIYWFMYDAFPSRACLEKNMVPLSKSIRNRVEELVLYKLECNGELMWPKALEDMERERQPSTWTWLLPTVVGVSMLSVFLLVVATYFTTQKIKRNRVLDRNECDVPIEDIIFYTTSKSLTTGQSRFVMWPSVTSLTDIEDIEDGFQMVKHILQWPGKWNGLTIGLRLLEIKGLTRLRRSTKKLLLWFRDEVNHPNILRFYGLAELQLDRYVVSDYCSKGPLNAILKDDKYVLSKDFKFSVSLEVINGLGYLHSKSIIHGNLRSAFCLIDYKWTVKLADWEYCYLYTHVNSKINPLLRTKKTMDEVGKDEAALLDFWTAPELVKSDRALHPTNSSDIYSYAIVLQEIFTRRNPYIEHADTLGYSDLLKAIVNNNLRPAHGQDTPTSVRQIMEMAWSETMTARPSIEQIIKMLRGAHSFKKTVLDTMLEATEEYTVSMEGRLQETKDHVTTIEGQLACFIERTIPPYLEWKFRSTPGRSALVSSAHVIAFKVPVPSRPHGDDEAILRTVHILDTKIGEMCQQYGAFKMDCPCGIFLLIVGIAKKDNQSALNAGLLALALTNEDTLKSLYEDAHKVFTCQCAIVHGDVYTGIVRTGAPKCYILGRTLEMSQKLLNASENFKILISKDFMMSLSRTKSKTLCWKPNIDFKGDPDLSETYWLSRETSTGEISEPTYLGLNFLPSLSDSRPTRSRRILKSRSSRRENSPKVFTTRVNSRKDTAASSSGVTPGHERSAGNTSGGEVLPDSKVDIHTTLSSQNMFQAAKGLESTAVSCLRQLLTLSLPKPSPGSSPSTSSCRDLEAAGYSDIFQV